MPDHEELEELTNDFLNDMIGQKEVDYHGRKAEQTEKLGTVGQCCGACGVPCENVCKD